MRQRAMIAIALAAEPKLLLADEPTTALDVTIQDQILKLLLRLARRARHGVILVTHDLGVVAETCDRVAVMYAGRIVETGTGRRTSSPRRATPTRDALLRSVPRGGAGARAAACPSRAAAAARPSRSPGCAFAPRCAFVDGALPPADARPPLDRASRAGRQVACLRAAIASPRMSAAA